MKNHKDDSDDETSSGLNKSVKATYGESKSRENLVNASDLATLQGVPPHEVTGRTVSHENNDQILDSTPGMEDPGTVNVRESSSLQGLPLKETEEQCKEIGEIPPDNELVNESITSKLQGVLKSTNHGIVSEDQATNSVDKSLELDNDNSILTDDVALPAIESGTEQSDQPTSNIDLQQDLIPESVTMNTEILGELSEFDTLLNIDDELDTGPPLVSSQHNQHFLEPTMDLEIAMDNAKFLETNPLMGQTMKPNKQMTSTSKRTEARLRTSSEATGITKDTGIPNNVRGKRIGSPKGVIQITSHVAMKTDTRRTE